MEKARPSDTAGISTATLIFRSRDARRASLGVAAVAAARRKTKLVQLGMQPTQMTKDPHLRWVEKSAEALAGLRNHYGRGGIRRMVAEKRNTTRSIEGPWL